jgi:hypothetical protein
MTTKVCRICRTEKTLGEFYNHSSGTSNTRSECKECTKERERYRHYGICNTKYDEMLTAQHGACAICKCTLNSTRYTKLAIDHDHKTGKVRGLLCVNCNTGIGLFKDSPIRLSNAISYLERSGVKDIV